MGARALQASPSRGWALEECLMLLPDPVKLLLLSATVPNAREIAAWVAYLHKARTPLLLLRRLLLWRLL